MWILCFLFFLKSVKKWVSHSWWVIDSLPTEVLILIFIYFGSYQLKDPRHWNPTQRFRGSRWILGDSRGKAEATSPSHHQLLLMRHQKVDVSKNRGTPKSSILIGFFIINHPFWGTPIFGNTQVGVDSYQRILIHSPKTNSSPLQIGRAPKGNEYSNHPFSGAMLVSGRVQWRIVKVYLRAFMNLDRWRCVLPSWGPAWSNRSI